VGHRVVGNGSIHRISRIGLIGPIRPIRQRRIMSTLGRIEKKTQQRGVKLFREQLGYEYLGDWTGRGANRNIEKDLLRTFLREMQYYDEALIRRALHVLAKAYGRRPSEIRDVSEIRGVARYSRLWLSAM